jgi:hypothetical protein
MHTDQLFPTYLIQPGVLPPPPHGGPDTQRPQGFPRPASQAPNPCQPRYLLAEWTSKTPGVSSNNFSPVSRPPSPVSLSLSCIVHGPSPTVRSQRSHVPKPRLPAINRRQLILEKKKIQITIEEQMLKLGFQASPPSLFLPKEIQKNKSKTNPLPLHIRHSY